MGARPQMRSSGQAFILRTLRGGVGGLQGSVRGGVVWQGSMSKRALKLLHGECPGGAQEGKPGQSRAGDNGAAQGVTGWGGGQGTRGGAGLGETLGASLGNGGCEGPGAGALGRQWWVQGWGGVTARGSGRSKERRRQAQTQLWGIPALKGRLPSSPPLGLAPHGPRATSWCGAPGEGGRRGQAGRVEGGGGPPR